MTNAIERALRKLTDKDAEYQDFVANGRCVSKDYLTFIDLKQRLSWVTDEMGEYEITGETDSAEYETLTQIANSIKSALGYEV